MVSRSFRIFATASDLEQIFVAFQKSLDVRFYKCGRTAEFDGICDITRIPSFGENNCGKRNSNKWLILPNDVIPERRIKKSTNDFFIDQELNKESVVVDIGGVYKGNILFPTEISTIWYENAQAKVIYDILHKVCKKSAKNVNGYFIAEEAHLQKEKYRFCTINADSPAEYDLKL